MPRVNGVDLTQFIRNDPDYNRIPILLITTEVNKEKKQAAFDAGVTALLQKPYDFKQFQLVVERLLTF
jgi:two-component system chemotaxis response regulator CheY